MTATLNPAYHPHEKLLAAYAAGKLPECTALFMAAHLDLCPACRQHLQTFEAKAGINLEDMPPGQLDTACLENLLQKIDEHGPPACIDVTIPVQNLIANFIPEPLQDYVGLSLEPANWLVHSEGICRYRPKKAFPGGLRLLRIQAGAVVKVAGEGMLLILEGEIRTLLHIHGPGDVVKNNWLPTLGRKAACEMIVLLV